MKYIDTAFCESWEILGVLAYNRRWLQAVGYMQIEVRLLGRRIYLKEIPDFLWEKKHAKQHDN